MTAAIKVGAVVLLPPAAGSYPLYLYLTGDSWPEVLLDVGKTISSTYSTGMFGNEYGRYFTDPEKSEDWWEYTFQALKKEKISVKDLFNDGESGDSSKEISKGFAESGEDSLSWACKKAYKTQKTNVDTSGGSGKYKEENVWKHCSPLIQKPKTLNDKSTDYSSGNFGQTNKSKLIDIKAKENERFWKFQKYRLGKTTNFATNSPFKEIKGNLFFGKSVQDICEEAYKSDETKINDYKSEVWDFCSLPGKETSN